MWIKQLRETLPQHTGGVDYSTPRDVVLRKGRITVWKTRGHTGWSGAGSTSYYGPHWCIDFGKGHREEVSLKGYAAGKVTAEMWTSWLPKIAKATGLSEDLLPQTVPRGGTLVWYDKDPKTPPPAPPKRQPPAPKPPPLEATSSAITEPGTYMLTQDFASPTPDRRVKDDWRCRPVLRAGTLLHIRESYDVKGYLVAWGDHKSYDTVSNKGRWEGLFRCLIRVEDTPSLLLQRERRTDAAAHILDLLFKKGTITMEDVTSALTCEREE